MLTEYAPPPKPPSDSIKQCTQVFCPKALISVLEHSLDEISPKLMRREHLEEMVKTAIKITDMKFGKFDT